MMRDEYDFSEAEQGKFYRSEAAHLMPIYLEPEVLSYFSNRAISKGVDLNDMINELLKNDIASIEAGK
jgi:hypothetical protein